MTNEEFVNKYIAKRISEGSISNALIARLNKRLDNYTYAHALMIVFDPLVTNNLTLGTEPETTREELKNIFIEIGFALPVNKVTAFTSAWFWYGDTMRYYYKAGSWLDWLTKTR